MMNSDFTLSLGIGLLVMLAIYIGLRRALGQNDLTIRRAMAVFSTVAGVMVTLYLFDRPAALEEQAGKIVLALVGVVLALIAVARRGTG